MSPRPLVGLSTYRASARWGQWHAPADLLPAAYADMVAAAGGVPVLLPPAALDTADVALSALDALVVSGGPDVDPSRYGARRAARTHDPDPARDAWELALLAGARERGTPVLGVCRGMQLLAVLDGGRLVQHLPDEVGHDGHRPGDARFGDHTVQVAAESRVGSLIGPRARVRCHHHQAVASHPGLRAVAWAEDGTTEALEGTGEGFWVGVQWHPEAAARSEETMRLARGLIEVAARRRAASPP